MSAINYTYYIDLGAGAGYEQVYPSGDWSLRIAKAEEDIPFCKDYRIKCDGEFIFSGNDYTLIKGADCCDKIDLKIKCNGEDYWFGYFSYPYSFNIDEDRCQITGTPKPLDKYYYFDQNSDEEVQLSATKTVTYQDNFDSAHANDPTADTWPEDCIDCEPVWDIIKKIVENPPLEPVDFTYIAKSSFFHGDSFPDLTVPYIAGKNYVTGCDNKLLKLVMAMAKDVNGIGDAEWPAWSWNDLIEILHNKFNVWWYIDEKGHVRIEHIYFWDYYLKFNADYDLRTIDGGRWIINSSEYDFRDEEMPRQESWLRNNTLQWNFRDCRVKYLDCYLPGVNSYIKEYPSLDFSADIEFIAPGTDNLIPTIVPDLIEDGDYMFLWCITRAEARALNYGNGGDEPIPGCDYVCWWNLSVDTGTDRLNAHLSAGNLFANYWMHHRPFWEGVFDLFVAFGAGDIDLAFESVWKNLRQRELVFPVCCDGKAEIILTGDEDTNPRYLYDFGIIFNKKIITQYLNGELYTGTIKDGMLTLQLVFEDIDCKGTPYVWPEKCKL